jgi:hypothetical protein
VKTAAFVLSALLLTSPVFSASAASESRTFTGIIGDSMCVRDHAAMKITPDDKCVRDCIKHSPDVKYVLLTKDKHYILSDQAMPEQFAGKKVKVKGVLYEKTGIIKVEGIEEVKSQK